MTVTLRCRLIQIVGPQLLAGSRWNVTRRYETTAGERWELSDEVGNVVCPAVKPGLCEVVR